MMLPFQSDWPRINQFPEYFTVEKGNNYFVETSAGKKVITYSGEALQNGLPVRVKSEKELKLIIQCL